MTKTTLIKSADWAVTWDANRNGKGGHVYKRGVDVAMKGNEISYVGENFSGEADETIDGRSVMVMPGLIDIHSHPTTEPGNKGLNEELGSPRLGQSSLYEYMPVFRMGAEAAAPATRFAIHEMLKSGVTTFADLSVVRDGWIDEIAETGIRGVIGPMFRSAAWRTRDGHSVVYDWDEAAGEAGLDRAIITVEEAAAHPSGRMSGMFCPSQVDTCTPTLLCAAREEARRLNVPYQIHAAQSVVEFNEITQRHGHTPIEFLDDVGVLDEGTIVAHGIFLNDHPWIHWPQADDFSRMARAGISVAHCPNVFWRRGIALNHITRYRAKGINLGLGTDTFPHNFIDEMKIAIIAARLMSGDFTVASTAEVFDIATIGGAKALMRDDIGRLAVGAKADVVLVDMDHPYMQPVRDPLRSLIYSASDRAVRDVYVDGIQVVREGEALQIDVGSAVEKLREGQQASISSVRQRDWANRNIDEMSPMVYPLGE